MGCRGTVPVHGSRADQPGDHADTRTRHHRPRTSDTRTMGGGSPVPPPGAAPALCRVAAERAGNSSPSARGQDSLWCHRLLPGRVELHDKRVTTDTRVGANSARVIVFVVQDLHHVPNPPNLNIVLRQPEG